MEQWLVPVTAPGHKRPMGAMHGLNLKRLIRAPIDYALPPRCPVCGVIVAGDHQFCASCWTRIDRLSPPWCVHCHLPLGENALEGDSCAACMAKRPPYGPVYAVTAYDSLSADIALQLKYGGRIGRATLIARQVLPLLPADARDWLFVPVPLHRWRLWRRGYNQALLIARAMARDLGAEVIADALIRTRATRPLKGLNPSQRQRALQGAIQVNPKRSALLAGRTVLLVDDVLTTGATAASCSRALQRSGSGAVHVACWARVIPGRAAG